MSGGSYEYLYYRLFEFELSSRLANLEKVADRLAEMKLIDAAEECHRIAGTIRKFLSRMSVYEDDFSGVLKAVEWMDSGDSCLDYVQTEVEKWRGK